MSKFRTLLIAAGICFSLGFFYLLYLQINKQFGSPEEDTYEITNNMVVEKIEALGKLELTRYYIKDVVEQKQIKDWWMPNSKVILIISGEVVGCIDLKKIDSSGITVSTDKIRIRLPQPEICYAKINHQESKVYDIENEFFDKAKLIDKAYAAAEKNLQASAIQMKILEQTKTNATALLKPTLESFTGKPVELYY